MFECQKCGKQFRSLFCVRLHERCHSFRRADGNNFTCGLTGCGRKFERYTNYMAHRRFHNRKDVIGMPLASGIKKRPLNTAFRPKNFKGKNRIPYKQLRKQLSSGPSHGKNLNDDRLTVDLTEDQSKYFQEEISDQNLDNNVEIKEQTNMSDTINEEIAEIHDEDPQDLITTSEEQDASTQKPNDHYVYRECGILPNNSGLHHGRGSPAQWEIEENGPIGCLYGCNICQALFVAEKLLLEHQLLHKRSERDSPVIGSIIDVGKFAKQYLVNRDKQDDNLQQRKGLFCNGYNANSIKRSNRKHYKRIEGIRNARVRIMNSRNNHSMLERITTRNREDGGVANGTRNIGNPSKQSTFGNEQGEMVIANRQQSPSGSVNQANSLGFKIVSACSLDETIGGSSIATGKNESGNVKSDMNSFEANKKPHHIVNSIGANNVISKESDIVLVNEIEEGCVRRKSTEDNKEETVDSKIDCVVCGKKASFKSNEKIQNGATRKEPDMPMCQSCNDLLSEDDGDSENEFHIDEENRLLMDRSKKDRSLIVVQSGDDARRAEDQSCNLYSMEGYNSIERRPTMVPSISNYGNIPDFTIRDQNTLSSYKQQTGYAQQRNQMWSQPSMQKALLHPATGQLPIGSSQSHWQGNHGLRNEQGRNFAIGRFIQETAMKAERKISEGLKPPSGNGSNRQFSWNSYNVGSARNDKSLRCKVCGHAFSREWNLKNHMRTHTGERPYPCHICNKRFAMKHHLKRHLQTHQRFSQNASEAKNEESESSFQSRSFSNEMAQSSFVFHSQ